MEAQLQKLWRISQLIPLIKVVTKVYKSSVDSGWEMAVFVIKVWELWPSAARRDALRLPWRASFNRFINTPTNRFNAACFHPFELFYGNAISDANRWLASRFSVIYILASICICRYTLAIHKVTNHTLVITKIILLDFTLHITYNLNL